MTAELPDRPAIRIADADRELTARRLRAAMEEGRITVSELEERLVVVYAARFAADLLPPVADLPDEQPEPAPPMTPSGPPVVIRMGRLRRLRRNGAWTVPPRLRVQSRMGSVLLDFCDADNPNPVVELELELGAGTATLLVPDDATVDIEHLTASKGSVRSTLPAGPHAGAPHFVVHGRAGVGTVSVRRRRRLAGRFF